MKPSTGGCYKELNNRFHARKCCDVVGYREREGHSHDVRKTKKSKRPTPSKHHDTGKVVPEQSRRRRYIPSLLQTQPHSSAAELQTHEGEIKASKPEMQESRNSQQRKLTKRHRPKPT